MLGLFALLAGVAFAFETLVNSQKKGPIGLVDATLWSGLYVIAALSFAVCLYAQKGPAAASLFLAGYVMEKVLSVDNLMVFVAIFAYFRIPDTQQHKVLHYGIIGAVVFRLVFVAVGSGSLVIFGPPVGLLFGLVVLLSAWKMRTGGDAEDVDYSAQWYARWASRILPFVNSAVDDKGTFFVYRRTSPGYWKSYGTPLLMALVTIEISDVLFSFDSVPAVIAITQDPVLVYSAMIFAILGLRMLYFVLTALLRYLSRLTTAVIAVLAFIGFKLIAESANAMWPGMDPDHYLPIPPLGSLAVVLTILGIGVVASIFWPVTLDTVKSDASIPS